MLLDSNIIIYAGKPDYQKIREFISGIKPAVSAVSYVEVLGYQRLSVKEKKYYEEFFSLVPVLPLSWEILNKAVEIRQLRKTTLGDSLVAASALEFNLTLVTRNVNDFTGISGLTVLNPFELNFQD